jgi:hypothetical protein
MMTAGDEVGDAAKKTRAQARQKRDQASEMHQLEDDLKRVAGQLDNQATILEQQAVESDEVETRTRQTMEKFKNQNR